MASAINQLASQWLSPPFFDETVRVVRSTSSITQDYTSSNSKLSAQTRPRRLASYCIDFAVLHALIIRRPAGGGCHGPIPEGPMALLLGIDERPPTP